MGKTRRKRSYRPLTTTTSLTTTTNSSTKKSFMTDDETYTTTSTNVNNKKDEDDVNVFHLWNIHGESYDLRSFVEYHPGGVEAIELGRGRTDCTALFESYHPFTNQHRIVLEKYKI